SLGVNEVGSTDDRGTTRPGQRDRSHHPDDPSSNGAIGGSAPAGGATDDPDVGSDSDPDTEVTSPRGVPQAAPPFPEIDRGEWMALVAKGRRDGVVDADEVSRVLRHVELTGERISLVQRRLAVEGIDVDES